MPGVVPRACSMLTHLTLIASHHCTDEETEVRNPFCLASVETKALCLQFHFICSFVYFNSLFLVRFPFKIFKLLILG